MHTLETVLQSNCFCLVGLVCLLVCLFAGMFFFAFLIATTLKNVDYFATMKVFAEGER